MRAGLLHAALACTVLGCTSEIIYHSGYDYAAIREKFQGAVTALVTNYHANGSVDAGAIIANVDSVVSRGIVTGDGVLKVYDDFPRLTVAQRKQVIDAMIQGARGRVPVIASVVDSNVENTIELAQYAEDAGADAIQVQAPYYYPTTVEDFNRTLALVMQNTKKIAVLIYNTPWEYSPSAGTAMDLSGDDIEMLANTWPRFLILKWATTDPDKFMKVIDRFKSRFAIVDNYGLWPTSYMLGATSFVTHWANLWPEWNVKLHRMLKSGQYKEAQDMIKAGYWPWSDFRDKIGQRTSSESAPVKAALDMLPGRVGGTVREPARRLDGAERAELSALMTKAGVPGMELQRPEDVGVV